MLREAKEMKEAKLARRPLDSLKRILSAESVREQLKMALAAEADLFVASLVELYSEDQLLQQCDPADVVREAFKAAVLGLPLSKDLGHVYLVPYRDKGGVIRPSFLLGSEGYTKLALRSGLFHTINAGKVHEGELAKYDLLSGMFELDYTKRKSDRVIGYFAYFKLKDGFEKGIYMTVDEVRKHAEKHSKSYHVKGGVWETDFDAMAVRTVLRIALLDWGPIFPDLERVVNYERKETMLTEKERDEVLGEKA
ncbi:MAG: recombinase RecT [Nitrososphaerota archaeon]